MARDQRNKLDTSNPFQRPTMADLTEAMLEDERPKPQPEIVEISVPTLALAEDGTIPSGHFRVTPTGLMWDEAATYDEWLRLGQAIRGLKGIQWIIGDYLLCGERQWGQTYEQVAEITGYTVETLYNFASVCNRVEFSLRNENLDFGHHNLIAAKSPDEQKYWLDVAVENELSVAALRAVMKPKATPLPDSMGKQQVESLFSREKKRDFGKFMRIGLKVGQGDQKARKLALGYIAEYRRWLDAVEAWLDEVE